ncbi:hypothetical protein CN918_31905 [Priestia megaterium]|nr:hypothetical protein CN918_31905 [Priestia megaterium]
MITIIKPQEIERYIYVYKETEKPTSKVIHFFTRLRQRELLSSIELIPYLEQPSKESILYLYPNGIICWNHPSLLNQTLESCLALIERNHRIHTTKICLCPLYVYEHEERKKQIVAEGMTIGQYAMEIKRLERAEVASLHKGVNWTHTFSELKKKKINSALDRYNIQKDLFDEFGEKTYQKRMNRWLHVLHHLGQM